MRIPVLLLLLLLATLTLKADGEQSGEGYILEPLEVLDRIPVADSAFIRHRGLPSSVDLAPHFPVPGSQGNQGSCVGWATTYALKTYHEKRKRNWDLGAPPQSGGNGEHVFSPAWTYNQINGGRDRGAHIPHALELLISKGAAPWSAMPYNVKDYRSQPSAEARRIAAQYRAKGYEQVPIHNVDALKAEGVQSVSVIPLFLAPGGHVREDLPRLVDAARTRFGMRLAVRPALGESAALLEGIARWIVDEDQA